MDAVVNWLILTAKGWPFLIVVGWIGLSFAAGLAWATANWRRPHEDDDDSYELSAIGSVVQQVSKHGFIVHQGKGRRIH